MNKEFLESLDLFRMPPPLIKKTKEQRQQEQLIQAQYRDFYKPGSGGNADDETLLTEEEREKHVRDKDKQEQNKKKEAHLKRMDDLKRLMINDIMRRGNSFFSMNSESGGGQYYSTEMLGESTKCSEEENKQRQEINRDSSYFEELKKVVEIKFETRACIFRENGRSITKT